jgi:AP-4 complex subunit epsilon-1
VSILKQVTDHRLPREFDYHRMPAPWIQMKLLRILSLLGRADQAASEQMYEVLLDVMRKADAAINVGYAIIYEAVRTVTTIYPNTTLLDAAVRRGREGAG